MRSAQDTKDASEPSGKRFMIPPGASVAFGLAAAGPNQRQATGKISGGLSQGEGKRNWAVLLLRRLIFDRKPTSQNNGVRFPAGFRLNTALGTSDKGVRLLRCIHLK